MNKNRGNILIIVLVVFLLVTTSVAGYFYLQYKQVKQDFVSKLKSDNQLIVNKQNNSSGISDPSYLDENLLLKKENYFYWKTYDNPKYHYSVQYPFGYQISLCSGCEDPNSGVTIAPNWYRNEGYGRIEILVSKYPEGKDFQKYYNEQSAYKPGINKVNIAGKEAWSEISKPNGKLDSAVETIYLINKDLLVSLSFKTDGTESNQGLDLSAYKNLVIFNRMSETFKFTQ